MIRAATIAAALLLLAVAILLAANAALDLHFDPEMAVAQAIAAVWIVQAPIIAALATRRTR